MSELLKRILFAIPAAAIFLTVTWFGDWYFAGTIIFITLFIQRELSIICGKAGFKPDDFFPYTIALWVLLIPTLPHAFEVGLIIFLLFAAVQVVKQSDHQIEEFISTLFCGLYAPLGFLTLLMIRNFGTTETGFLLTVSLLLMVWGNDVFAYFGGKNFGSRLLAPKISPKKTWEGFLFGILGAAVGLLIAIYLLPFEFPASLAATMPLAVFVSTFGPLGDLAESKLKRAAGVKDSSNILPGHGGFFDRFDALILAAPAFYVYIYFLEVMGYVSF